MVVVDEVVVRIGPEKEYQVEQEVDDDPWDADT